jgi:hypothetical protein
MTERVRRNMRMYYEIRETLATGAGGARCFVQYVMDVVEHATYLAFGLLEFGQVMMFL